MNYKPWSILLLGFLFVLSCDQVKVKEPTFVRLGKVSPTKIGRDTIAVSCDAIYNNPNLLGGILEQTNVNVYINDNFVTQVTQRLHTEIPGNQEFILPLTIKVPVENLLKSKGSLLDNVLQTLVTRSFTLRYSGEAKFKFAKIPMTIPIEREETVKIKI